MTNDVTVASPAPRGLAKNLIAIAKDYWWALLAAATPYVLGTPLFFLYMSFAVPDSTGTIVLPTPLLFIFLAFWVPLFLTKFIALLGLKLRPLWKVTVLHAVLCFSVVCLLLVIHYKTAEIMYGGWRFLFDNDPEFRLHYFFPSACNFTLLLASDLSLLYLNRSLKRETVLIFLGLDLVLLPYLFNALICIT